jgi:hypothetical protein
MQSRECQVTEPAPPSRLSVCGEGSFPFPWSCLVNGGPPLIRSEAGLGGGL